MQRYFVSSSQVNSQHATISGDDARHIRQVMRFRTGDSLIVSDGRSAWRGEIVKFLDGAVKVRLTNKLQESGEPDIEVWIAQSLPKADKMEIVMQKCTEAGAVRFLPFISHRTVVKYDAEKERKRLERWRKIVKEAAEQAHRGRIPAIESIRSWQELLPLVKQVGCCLICYEQEQGNGMKEVLKRVQQTVPAGSLGRDKPILLMIGPEGGFTEEEVREVEKAGGISISLGSRILRTETAGLVALTCILYEFDEIGGMRHA